VRDPDGQRDADRQINQVRGDFDVHNQPPLGKTEHVQLSQDKPEL
jgi:hypothetical protein